MVSPSTERLSQENVDTLIETALSYRKLPSHKWRTFDASIDSGVPQRIFTKSQHAWMVYAVVKGALNSHKRINKKEECQHSLELLDRNGNVDAIQLLHDRIAIRSREEQARIEKFLTEAQSQRRKRPRIEVDDEDEDSRDEDEGSHDEDEEIRNDDNLDKDNVEYEQGPSMGRDEQSISRTTNEMQWDVFYNASLDAIVSLFPQFLADAIERRPHSSKPGILVAAVDMQIPSRSELYKLGCLMAIHVLGSAIPRLARDLFDVYVEQDATGLYVAHPGGAKLRPKPSLNLDGCRIDAIPTFFGEETHRAIRSSDCFQEAQLRRYSKTTAVTMTIATQESRGTLFLNLGVLDGGTISSQLYVPLP